MYNIRDIAIFLDAKTSRNTLRLAARIAAQYDAHITAFFSVPPLPAIQYAQSARISFEVRQRYTQSCREDAEAACAAFEKAMKHAGVLSSSVVDDGDSGEIAINRFKYADIAIVQQDVKRGSSAVESIVDRILLQSGRPVLLVPQDCKSEDFAKAVVIAWDGSKEATRAVHDAMPILRSAESVEILHVVKDSQLPADVAVKPKIDETADRLVLHLARNDIRATVSSQRKVKGGTGATIIGHASNSGADLIVSGAWGHRRAWEYTFGGATRSLLDGTKTPVLMSH